MAVAISFTFLDGCRSTLKLSGSRDAATGTAIRMHSTADTGKLGTAVAAPCGFQHTRNRVEGWKMRREEEERMHARTGQRSDVKHGELGYVLIHTTLGVVLSQERTMGS
jgi:hypothetical protein